MECLLEIGELGRGWNVEKKKKKRKKRERIGGKRRWRKNEEQSLKMDMKDRNERFIHCGTGFFISYKLGCEDWIV